MKHGTWLAICLFGSAPMAWNQPARPAFEVASVKVHEFPPGMMGLQIGGPSQLHISGNRVNTMGSLEMLVMAAYHGKLHQVSGGPKWTDRAGNPLVFDIDARVEGEGVAAMEQVRLMLQSLLAERFHLQIHQENKEVPVYALTVDKGGPKLKESAPGTETKAAGSFSRGNWKNSYTNMSMGELTTHIASNFDRPLLDRTGLTGSYDFLLEYRATNLYVSPEQAAAAAQRADAGPTIFTALQLLGLKVVQTRGPVEMTIIDSAEKPSAN